MRGFFVSLASVLLIGIILISVIAAQEREQAQTELDLMNLENRIAANYIEVLTDVTIPREIAKTLKTSLRDSPSIMAASAAARSNTVEGKIESEYDKLGLGFESVEVDITSVSGWRHLDNWTISADYEFDLRAQSNRGIVWEVTGESGTLEFSVAGFVHPNYDSTTELEDYGYITKEFWVVNASDSGCFLNSLSNSLSCDGAKQLCPLAICR